MPRLFSLNPQFPQRVTISPLSRQAVSISRVETSRRAVSATKLAPKTGNSRLSLRVPRFRVKTRLAPLLRAKKGRSGSVCWPNGLQTKRQLLPAGAQGDRAVFQSGDNPGEGAPRTDPQGQPGHPCGTRHVRMGTGNGARGMTMAVTSDGSPRFAACTPGKEFASPRMSGRGLGGETRPATRFAVEQPSNAFLNRGTF